jgi:LuxR family maltose regulon positive regulatory protein
MLLGEPDAADAAFTIAAEAAERLRATDTRILALSERSLLAGASGDDGRARALAGEARALAEARPQDGYSTCAIQLAASALVELKNGNAERVRADLDNADLLRPRLTYAVPWLSVQTLLELARARMGLLDLVGARSLVADADAIVRRRPELGTLAARARVLRADLAELAQTHDRRRLALTAAELRLVPLLATHLSFREIGERLHISRNTVKTQAIAVYRKLGVSSRSDAIELAATLGVVRPTVPEDDRITLPG